MIISTRHLPSKASVNDQPSFLAVQTLLRSLANFHGTHALCLEISLADITQIILLFRYGSSGAHKKNSCKLLGFQAYTKHSNSLLWEALPQMEGVPMFTTKVFLPSSTMMLLAFFVFLISSVWNISINSHVIKLP